MKTFGLVVPSATGSRFERHVEALLADQADLHQIIHPLLQAWHAVRLQAADLSRKLLADARRSDACQLLMTVPGVGAVTATSFVAAIEDPRNFKHSRSVGAWLGLTTRRYQSGEVDFDGHISRRGDGHLRGLLYEAATVLLTRTKSGCDLRQWGFAGAREARVLARSGCRCSQAGRHHAQHAGDRGAVPRRTSQSLINPVPQRPQGASRRPPERRLTHSVSSVATAASQLPDCVVNLGRVTPRSPIMRRLMPTAKTTMLPAMDTLDEKPCTRRD